LGRVETRTGIFEARAADGMPERLPARAAALVQSKVDVIVTAGTSAAGAARKATATIAIVMATGSDPIGLGLVASLARPGGNVTGVTTLTTELSAKRLELAREVVPGTPRLAILGDAGSAAPSDQRQDTKEAARVLGVHLEVVTVRRVTELEGAFSRIARDRPTVLLVLSTPLFFGERRRLADLALKHRLPTVHADPEYAEAGGLIAYGIKLV